MAEPLSLDSTYEEILEDKLDNIDDTLDKREGTSLIYNAVAANTLEIAQMLATLKDYIDFMYADTAPMEYLERRALERGLIPYPATKARLKAIFNIDVPIGSRFSGQDDLNYVVIEKITDGEFIVECETEGNIGNIFLGTIVPIDYIEGLETAELTEVLIPGEDKEDVENFRQRYFNSFNSQAFGGNRADYKEKVGAIDGVGGVRVYRAWNGGGTVKLVIIDSQFNKPSQALINKVQEKVDPLNAQGEGLGIAPIDHIVTAFPVNEFPIDIQLNLTYQNGWTWEDVEQNVKQAIDDYFATLAEQWAKAQTYEDDHTGVTVRVSQIEIRLLNIPGILDIADTKLNGDTSNIVLDKEAIPKRGVVSG